MIANLAAKAAMAKMGFVPKLPSAVRGSNPCLSKKRALKRTPLSEICGTTSGSKCGNFSTAFYGDCARWSDVKMHSIGICPIPTKIIQQARDEWVTFWKNIL